MLLDYILLQLPTEKVIVRNYYLKDTEFRGPSYILEKTLTFIYPYNFLLMSNNIENIVDLCKLRGWKFRDLTGELK